MNEKRWGAVHAELYERLWLPMLERLGYATLLADLLRELPASGNVLDIGAGTGAATRALLNACPEAGVYSLDPAAACSRRAGAATPHHQAGRVRYVQGRAECLPFEEGTFQAAISFLLLCHLHDPAPCIAEMARVLQPGGVAVIFTRTHDVFGRLLRFAFPILNLGRVYLHTAPALCRAFQQQGFVNVEAAAVGHGVTVRAVRLSASARS